VAGTFALRRTRGAPRQWRVGAAAGRLAWRELPPADADRFLDVVIMISVALFMLLFTGVGILVLQNSVH
jgi:hypothetical protein